MGVALDIITNALMEIGAYAQGEVPSAADSSFVLSKLNRLLDQWNARRLYIYNLNFAAYNIVPNLQPHTIGPNGATFNVPIRPVLIKNANIILNSSNPSTWFPLAIRDDDWWAANRVRTVTTTLPTDLYYSPSWPNGQIFLWPVPTVAYQLEVETANLQGPMLLNSLFSFPPGYEDAITYSLALSICPAFEKQPSPALVQAQKDAIETIRSVNSTPVPTIRLNGNGLSSTNRNRASFNWLTGGITRGR